MARRLGRPLLPVVLCAALFGAVTLVAHQAVGTAQPATASSAACVGNLDRTTYGNGFSPSDFTTTTATAIVPGSGLQLDTNLAPLNPEKIVLPFDQDVRIKSVYNNAGATHSLGWLYLDQLVPAFYDPVKNQLVDADHDGVPDLYRAIYTQPSGGGTPRLLAASSAYADGGNYPHIPNLLEPYDPVANPSGIGHLVFKIMNDNAATGWTFTYNNVDLPPLQDASSSVDGIFDYDVNGDGTVGNEPDRTVDLGILQGGREIVFYLVVYWGQTGKDGAYGIAGAGNASSGVTVHFSKTVLNTDQGGATANDTISYIDIGQPGVKSTGNVCEKATPFPTAGATAPGQVPTPLVGQTVACSGTPYPGFVHNDAHQQSLVFGWLSQTAISRLATAVYGNLVLPHEVHRVVAGPAGTVPHYFIGAPSNDQNRWIIGFEDLLGYTAASCASCTQSDFSLEDVVLLIERSNGGQVISQNVASDIPASQLSQTIISRIRVRYAVTLPAGCAGDASAGVQLYYSVNGGASWRAVPMPNPLAGDVVVDVLGNGDVGNTLQWKAVFTSSSQTCQPELNTMNVGYEAVQHGEYKFAAPIPLSNLVYSGSLETPSSAWTTTRNDFSLRGHFYASPLFDAATLKDSTAPPLWDAGAKLAARAPSTRYLFTNNGAATPGAIALTSANGGATVPVAGVATTLYKQLVPAAVRTLLSNGKLVYDYNGDGRSDDTDAQFVLEWTRGWEFPAGVTFAPAPPTQPQARAWPLGPIHDSSPALVGPPGHPAWLDSNAPGLASYVAAFNSFKAANQTRRTLAIVGAQDGMLHGFNAGSFRQSPDAACAVNLARGCFAGTPADYGDGAETWAYVPPRLLSSLKNNHPLTRGYLPASNPAAEVDGSVAAEDLWIGAGFTTAVFASLGRNQPYVTALRIDGDPANPQPLWPDDFTDADYNGSNFSPGVVPWATTPTGPRPLVVVSSGLADAPQPSYLYLLDAATGKLIKNGSGATVGKVALDAAGTSLGIAGYPSVVDADQDGIFDRVYVADTAGRIYKVDLTTPAPKACVVASVGESVFAGLGVAVTSVAGTAPRVRVYLGGAPNPDGSSNPPVSAPYHLFGFEDDDAVGACATGGAHKLFTYTLPPPGKLWAAPAIVQGTPPSGNVYFATAGGSSESVCDTAGGSFIPLALDGDAAGNGVVTGPIATLAGEAVSSIRVYDGHALVDGVAGQTSIIGARDTWNTTPASVGAGGNFSFATVNWLEY